MFSLSQSAVAYSANLGLLEVRAETNQWFEKKKMLRILDDLGSGSTYVYGYCDATFKEGWGRDETIEFVKNSGVFSIASYPKI